jgi:hypothetical protein
MWEGAAATEHSHSRTPQSSDMLPQRRIAADGTAYVYTDFVNWYGTHAGQMWERAAATEHSESSSIATDALPAMEPQAAATRRCSTQADSIVGGATEHLYQLNHVYVVPPSSSIATDALPALEPQAPATSCCSTQADFVEMPRDATEHSPWEKALPAHTGNTLFVPQDAHEHALVPMPASSTISPQETERLLQCVDCERLLCGTEDLAFFRRTNKQGGVEVHLMLKPENNEPATFIRSLVGETGAIASWQCACGFKLGDTRAVAVNKAAMTAFKSSSVMLCGQRFTGRKSKWPSIYNEPPFNAVEVRTRDTFFGHTPACSSAS